MEDEEVEKQGLEELMKSRIFAERNLKLISFYIRSVESFQLWKIPIFPALCLRRSINLTFQESSQFYWRIIGMNYEEQAQYALHLFRKAEKIILESANELELQIYNRVLNLPNEERDKEVLEYCLNEGIRKMVPGKSDKREIFEFFVSYGFDLSKVRIYEGLKEILIELEDKELFEKYITKHDMSKSLTKHYHLALLREACKRHDFNTVEYIMNLHSHTKSDKYDNNPSEFCLFAINEMSIISKHKREDERKQEYEKSLRILKYILSLCPKEQLKHQKNPPHQYHITIPSLVQNAYQSSNLPMLEYLKSQEFDVSSSCKYLQAAVFSESIDTVKFFLNSSPKLTLNDVNYYRYAMMGATQLPHLEILDILEEYVLLPENHASPIMNQFIADSLSVYLCSGRVELLKRFKSSYADLYPLPDIYRGKLIFELVSSDYFSIEYVKLLFEYFPNQFHNAAWLDRIFHCFSVRCASFISLIINLRNEYLIPKYGWQ